MHKCDTSVDILGAFGFEEEEKQLDKVSLEEEEEWWDRLISAGSWGLSEVTESHPVCQNELLSIEIPLLGCHELRRGRSHWAKVFSL